MIYLYLYKDYLVDNFWVCPFCHFSFDFYNNYVFFYYSAKHNRKTLCKDSYRTIDKKTYNRLKQLALVEDIYDIYMRHKSGEYAKILLLKINGETLEAYNDLHI